MAPFRPTYLNKRYYPGNASVVGPTCRATIGITTTQCCSCICTICGAQTATYVLGCRCMDSTYDCCQCCCCCSCTVCAPSIPGGKYSKWEQYEAASRNAWGPSICSTGAQIGFCANTGTTSGGTVDCKGFYVCCGPSNNRWFVAPSCTEVRRSWLNSGQAVTVANSCMGSCGWFVPTIGQLTSAGYSCRSYWDSFPAGRMYWSNSYAFSERVWSMETNGGGTYTRVWNNTYYIRTFRCTAT